MRKVLYAAIVLALFLAPLEKMDIAKLLPVETVSMYTEGGDVVLQTNTENTGRGESVSSALENLKEVTPAVIYLDTAKYLLVDENAIDYVDDLRQHLKQSVEVAVCNAKAMVKEGAKYFASHGGTVQLKDWKR